MTSGNDTHLRRDIGFTGSAFLAFNGIVGAGIFALPGTLHEKFGTFSPWLFPIFGLLIMLVVLPFARQAALHSGSGGPVAYTAPFGPAIAFQTGWLYYVARLTALAANANFFAISAASLWPPLDGRFGRATVILGLISFVTWVNLVGVRRAVRVLEGITLLKALPVVTVAMIGIAVAGANLGAPIALPEFSAIELSALAVLYAFVGFENAVVPAGETRDARRTIPRALIFTVAATAVFYFLVQLAYVAVMPQGPAPRAPLATMAETLIGPWGFVILSLTAVASIAGNVLSSVTSTPRITFALSEAESLPRWFGRLSPRWHTPTNSILFMAALGATLALTGDFLGLAIVSSLARLFVYGLSIAALPKAEKPGIGGWALIVTALAICLWAAAQSEWRSWAMLGGLITAGLLLYALARRQAGSSSAATVSEIQPPPSTRSPE